VSTGWLSGVFGTPMEEVPTWAEVAAATPAAEDVAPVVTVDDAIAAVEDPGTTMERVRVGVGLFVDLLNDMLERNRSAPACKHCRRGESAVDMDVALKLGRGLMSAGPVLKKIEPEVPADPNEAPDMVLAALAVREQLHSLVDRALADRGEM
jgi:hypothetical protein